MEELQQKQLAFLEDTIGHYNINNRCVKYGECRYSPKSIGLEGISEGCAIGRHLTEKLALSLDKGSNTVVYKPEVFKKLPGSLRKLGKDFLSEVQCLHDNTRNWDESGLSVEGENKVRMINLQFNLI